MSIINLMKSYVWSEDDIVNAGREIIASKVSEARQNELRTIMLGHIAQMRTATPQELQEIGYVQQVTEKQVIDNDAARADMALLQSTLDYEAAIERMKLPPSDAPGMVEITDMDGTVRTVVNPVVDQDMGERSDAQDVIDGASQAVLDLYTLRNPAPVVEEEVILTPV